MWPLLFEYLWRTINSMVVYPYVSCIYEDTRTSRLFFVSYWLYRTQAAYLSTKRPVLVQAGWACVLRDSGEVCVQPGVVCWRPNEKRTPLFFRSCLSLLGYIVRTDRAKIPYIVLSTT